MPTLQFKGKTFVQNHHLAVPFHQLVPQPDKSLTDKVSLNDNLLVKGDNLAALKALLPTYSGKVKCIYIDPPYNTGNEGWVYNDNVKSPLIKEWIGKVVGKDLEDLVRHDKWLCMMMPRLKLLRELLSDDGVIYISIDDAEQHRLRLLMDEIFGENNFVTNIIWQKKFSPQNDAKYFSDNHDFILCYAKTINNSENTNGWKRKLLARNDENNARYSNPDNDPRGVWASSDMTVKSYTPDYDYPITTPSGKVISPTKGRCWFTSRERMDELISDNRVWFGENGQNVPRVKKFLSEVKDGIVPLTIWLHSEVGHNQQAKQEIKEIFSDGELNFDTPKPVTLIKRILELSCDENDIILDSFAGSGTTAQAVLELNKEDGGNRKFVLIECEDYADTITAERVRRVIKGVPTAKNELVKKGLGGSFSYFELGDAIEMESLLAGKTLPSYKELGRYLFYTATGEEFKQDELDESSNYVGKTDQFDAYMFYKPELEYLKTTALTLDTARALREKAGNRPLLVFAPTKYVEQQTLDELNITFCQLPFEIYRLKN